MKQFHLLKNNLPANLIIFLKFRNLLGLFCCNEAADTGFS